MIVCIGPLNKRDLRTGKYQEIKETGSGKWGMFGKKYECQVTRKIKTNLPHPSS